MEWILVFLSAVAISAACGFRAFLPPLALAAAARLGWTDLRPDMAWLESNFALFTLGIAALVEIAGDKIPVVDHALDAVGTVLRPLASAASVFALTHDWPLPLSIAAALAIGSLSLGTHFLKAGLRIGSTATTGGMANPLLSFLEDGVAVVGILIALVAPLLLVLVLAVVVLGITRRSRRRIA